MAGLYLQLCFSFYKSTILRRAWAISPEFKKKKRERKNFSLIRIWILFKSHQFSLEKGTEWFYSLTHTPKLAELSSACCCCHCPLYWYVMAGRWPQPGYFQCGSFLLSGCNLSRTKFWLFSLSEHTLQSPDNTYAEQSAVKHLFPWC